jgi:tripartite ATP-independent transporter DctP family solute receptor
MGAREIVRTILVIVIFLVGSVTFSGRADAKTTLRMIGILPVSHQINQAAELFIKEVEKNSNGEIEIQHFPAGQLYNYKSSIPVLQSGGVDMGVIFSGMWTGVVPSVEIIGFMTYFKNAQHLMAVMDGYPGAVINRDFEEKGHLRILTYFNFGQSEICSKDPLVRLEDFKGKRIRAGGAVEALFVQALGAAPVSIDAGEVYQALQRGTVDGAIGGPSNFDTRKWYEVAKYATLSNIRPANFHFLVVNTNTWNRFSPQLQKVLMEAAKKAQEYNFKAAAEEDKTSMEKVQKLGMVFNKITDREQDRMREAGMDKLMDLYRKAVGQESAKKICDAVEELRKKY